MAEKKLAGKKVLMVIAQDQFRDEELLQPKEIFESEGASVTVASGVKSECKGMLGAKVKPDMLIGDARADDYDAVLVSGGMGSPTHLWNDTSLHGLLKQAKDSGKVVGAICLSGAVLAKAGLLKGVEATVYPDGSAIKELEKGGANYQKKPVVTAGDIITGEDPTAAKLFGRAVADRLAKK